MVSVFQIHIVEIFGNQLTNCNKQKTMHDLRLIIIPLMNRLLIVVCLILQVKEVLPLIQVRTKGSVSECSGGGLIVLGSSSRDRNTWPEQAQHVSDMSDVVVS